MSVIQASARRPGDQSLFCARLVAKDMRSESSDAIDNDDQTEARAPGGKRKLLPINKSFHNEKYRRHLFL